MAKNRLGEKREVLLRVELPDPHRHLTVKAFVTLQGRTAHLVQELEEVEQKPRATLLRELIEDGLTARMVDVEQKVQTEES